MKKIILFIVISVIIIVSVVTLGIRNVIVEQNELSSFNAEFETYLDKTLYGADVLSIINKALDENSKNNIEKDDKGFFIEDDNLSVKVELVLLSTNDDGEIINTTYQMETLQQVGLDNFISSFGLTTFECTNIEYNTSGRVCKLTLTQLEI